MVFEVIHEVPALQQLQDHVERVVGLVDLVELDDVDVVERSHDLNFIDERFLELDEETAKSQRSFIKRKRLFLVYLPFILAVDAFL